MNDEQAEISANSLVDRFEALSQSAEERGFHTFLMAFRIGESGVTVVAKNSSPSNCCETAALAAVVSNHLGRVCIDSLSARRPAQGVGAALEDNEDV